jgi:hypothetical protein
MSGAFRDFVETEVTAEGALVTGPEVLQVMERPGDR